MHASLASARPARASIALRQGSRLRAFASTGALVPLLLGLVYLASGVWLEAGLGIFEGDAISRTANAMNVVLGRDPHLAAIGFVWNPLPSLVQVPLVLALDPFGLTYLAAPITSAAFAAGTLHLLDRLFRSLGLGRRLRVVLLLGYGLNPITLFYAANGLSEAPLIFFLVGGTYQYIQWIRGGGFAALAGFSIFSAGAFWVRYEGAAFAAAGVAALVLAYWAHGKVEPERLEATLLAFLTPVAYSVGLWVYFNWQMMGDPLYFQRSTYGNLAQTQNFRSGQTYLSSVVGSAFGSLSYAFSRWALVGPLAPVVSLAILVRAAVRREGLLLGVLCLAVCVPLFHASMLYSGTSFGWLRFFLYSLPFGVIMLAYVLRDLRPERESAVVRLGWAVGLGLLLVAGPTSGWAMAQPDLGREESGVMRYLFEGAPLPASFQFAAEREVARYVDQAPPGTVVLMDSFLGFPANLFSQQHQRFAITSDRDFRLLVANPTQGATHLLVPYGGCPDGQTCLVQSDQVAAAHPDVWAHGAGWLQLERDFGGPNRWRLYRIVPPTSG